MMRLPSDDAGAAPAGLRPARAIPLALAALVVAVYWQAGAFPFAALDDVPFIRDNPALAGGLTMESLRWAFSDIRTFGWLPVTWISHLLDISLFGMNAGPHHLVSVLYHATGAILLYAAVRRMTGKEAESGFVAALFAVHPLHVEAVVWLSERREVLGGLFWALSLLAYARYAERPGARRYAFLVLAFALGLLSKPTVVTLPFVLLLLDCWPLGRLRLPGDSDDGPAPRCAPAPLRRLILEKVPLLALSAAAAAVAWVGAVKAGAVAPLEGLPAPARLAYGAIEYASYLGKAAWPTGLAVLYPHPGIGLDPREAAAAALLLAILSFLAVRALPARKWAVVGWLWFLGTMVPMIGIVQVGKHGIADRYTYIPLTGLFLLVVWGASEAAGKIRSGRSRLGAAGCILVLLLASAAWRQAGYWRDSVTLFERTLQVTTGNWLIENSLGVQRSRRGESAEAIAHFREAIRIRPAYDFAWFNLGMEMERVGDFEEAARCYGEALRINPGDPDARARLVMLGGVPPPPARPGAGAVPRP
jgi:tetratricopeptide (TPR) repeat protein